MESKTENLMQSGSFWFSDQAALHADKVDFLFYVVGWASILLFVIMMLFGLFCILKYKKSDKNPIATEHIIHNDALEIAWTVIPTLLVIGLFWWGYRDYLKLVVPSDNSQVIYVTAKKWLWQFENPKTGIKSLNELVIPINKPVKLVMTSEDILHSFFIPSFRAKKDLIPNRYSKLWFNPQKIGTFQVFCAEFCGDGHSNMLATITVLSDEDYAIWLKQGAFPEGVPLHEIGQKLYKAKACNTCHTLDGGTAVGPSWKGLYNDTRLFNTGKSIKADEAYLKESILYPNKKIVKGYAPLMPTYSGLLSDQEIKAIIEFIKTVK